jgi:CBS domain-containing protein
MKIKDAMHKGAEWVAPATSVYDIAKKMRDLDIGAIPVGDNDRLIGMVTDRDIACRGVANERDCAKLTARDVMSKGIIYCRDTEELEDALRIMEQKQVRRLPVINDQKRMVGAGRLSFSRFAEETSSSYDIEGDAASECALTSRERSAASAKATQPLAFAELKKTRRFSVEEAPLALVRTRVRGIRYAER